MIKLPSRFRRLDDALASLPGEEEPMLLTELDGLLTGVLVSPEPIASGEWLPIVWGGGPMPFEDPLDARWFADIVIARHDEIARDLARGRHQPIFDVDERNGEVLWEAWIDGFTMAMELRSELWSVDPDGTEDALAGIATLIDVARDESDLTSDEINAICDAAPALIPRHVLALHALRSAGAETPAPAAVQAKPGRNDPCHCGSGKKYKRCCG